jgi:hypothetical protein
MEGIFLQPRVDNHYFSVNVVVPASGAEMAANERRFWISLAMLTKVGNGNKEPGGNKSAVFLE